ncbi:hypothetical protein TKK_0009889 [Trichogramma kaykai]|uniref:Uncharacterized protein n=1 Tax=Trichogramma kaykai TaxID=54128 RepID=A0ABD2X0Z2_9HYME
MFNPSICAKRWENEYFGNNHRATVPISESALKKEDINGKKFNSSPIKVSNPSSRSVLSCIENVNVPPKRSIFDVSGHSSPLMFSSESDGNENSPPRKLAKCTTRSGHEPSPKVINTVFEPEVISEPSCSPDNHDIEVIDNVPYMVPVLNPCGRPKGAVKNAFGLKLNSCELQPYGQLHIDIRAEMILERIVRSKILLNTEYGVHPIHFHELYCNLPCWIFDDNVDINIVANYFQNESYQ